MFCSMVRGGMQKAVVPVSQMSLGVLFLLGITACVGNMLPTDPDVVWRRQYQQAIETAQSQAPGYLLDGISVTIDDIPLHPKESQLRTEFSFLNLSGDMFFVTYRNMQSFRPSSTSRGDIFPPPSVEHFETLRPLPHKDILDPFAVLEVVWEEAHTTVERDELQLEDIGMSLNIEFHITTTPRFPLTWLVFYRTKTANGERVSLLFWVDAETGQILEKGRIGETELREFFAIPE